MSDSAAARKTQGPAGDGDASGEAVAPQEETFLEKVREAVLRGGGLDIGPYNRRYILRRLAVRERALGLREHGEYLKRLHEDPAELPLCLEALTIHVTEFFRDRELWAFLRRDVLPRLVREAAPERGLRVWSAGCATGEEAWSIAVLMSVALEEAGTERSWEVLGTDIDAGALEVARLARYTDERMGPVPPPLRPRHFEPARGGGWTVREALRRHARFAVHDLLTPFAGEDFDLVLCRNVLMYFSAPQQGEIFRRLNAALRPGGYLVTGQVERPAGPAAGYETVDAGHHVFRKPLSMEETA